MNYQLGVDLGTTYTAAAISRHGRVEVYPLGTTSPVIPSVVLLRADGAVLVGEAAVRRGADEPTRVAREFKRRLGDPAPLVLGGTPYGAEALMSRLLGAVVQLVTEREGAAPDRVVLTHPANYGPYKMDMMREVARQAGLDLATTSFLTEPEAAAISYASRNRVEPGEIVAVYDFGGGTFDAALLQRSDHGFSLIGRPEGMDRFGGIDIDDAILAHVDGLLGGAIRAMDPDDPAVNVSVARLKDDCRAAKEALSVDTDTSIDVALPGIQTRLRLTRRELEDMVRPRLKETVVALDRAVRSAGLTFEQVSRILLVGGSSRMPLVGETIRRETGRPLAVDAHPKFAIATGAAAFGLELPGSAAAALPAAPASASPPGVTPPMVPAAAPPLPRQRFEATASVPNKDGKKRRTLIGAGVVALLVIAGIVFAVTRGDDSPASAPSTSVATTSIGSESIAVTTVGSAATATAPPNPTASTASVTPSAGALTFTDRIGFIGKEDQTLYKLELTKAGLTNVGSAPTLTVDARLTNFSTELLPPEITAITVLSADGSGFDARFDGVSQVPGGGTVPLRIIADVNPEFVIATASLVFGQSGSNQTILPFDSSKAVTTFVPIVGVGKGATASGGTGTVATITDGIVHEDFSSGAKGRYRLDLFVDLTYANAALARSEYEEAIITLTGPDGAVLVPGLSSIFKSNDVATLTNGETSHLGLSFGVSSVVLGDYHLDIDSSRVRSSQEPGAVNPVVNFTVTQPG